MIEAFIFDIDGTLIDTREYHIKSWQKAFAKYGLEVSAEKIQSHLGKRALEIAQSLLPADKQPQAKEIIEEKWKTFRDYIPNIKVFPKVLELIRFLHEKNIKLALATSTIRTEAEYYIDLFQARDILGAVITAEDINKSKPNPEIFLKAADKLNVEPSNCIAVGDSPHDMKAAKSAGMIAVGVLTGGYNKDDLKAAGADIIYSDINDLYNNISSLLAL